MRHALGARKTSDGKHHFYAWLLTSFARRLSAYAVGLADDASCARLTSASCPQRGFFSVCPWLKRAMHGSSTPTRGCSSTTTLLFDARPSWRMASMDEIDFPELGFHQPSAQENWWIGNTTAGTGLERAIGSLGPCNSAGHILTCHSTSDSQVLAANNLVHSITNILRTTSETAMAHASTIETRRAVNSYFARLADTRASGSFLSRLSMSVRRHDARPTRAFWALTSAAAARVSNASYHLADVAPSELLESELTKQSSSIGQGRFFPILSIHNSSDSDMLKDKNKTFVPRACACFFFLRCVGASVLLLGDR